MTDLTFDPLDISVSPEPDLFAWEPNERRKTSHEWPDERKAELRALWEAGELSASQIGVALGMTKNAVLGQRLRMGLVPRKKTPKAKQSRSHPFMARVPVKFTAPSPLPLTSLDKFNAALPRLGSILELTEDTCRWPVGNPGQPGFGFCCQPVDQVSPYCAGHHRFSVVPSTYRGM